MWNARTGKRYSGINKSLARKIALSVSRDTDTVVSVELISHTGRHHEIRNARLPAYAVTMGDREGLVIYIDQKSGEVISFRTDSWRVFDFFWMLHTMDFYGRDNFNNYLLRGFALLGLITIASGFLLFFVSSGRWRRRRQAKFESRIV